MSDMERKKQAKANNKSARQTKISWTVRPKGMSLVEWQRALRRQVAGEELMACRAVDERNLPGEYEVKNPLTRQTYKVVYRGEKSPWNYCSCMDFRTSRLGTCKHIERVRAWTGKDSKRRVHAEPPSYTSVYLSYTEGRQVKIRVGSEHHEEFTALAGRYFDAEGVMFPHAFEDYGKLMAEAVAIDPSFRFYQDAIDFILEQRERKFREQLITKYTDKRLDELLTVTLYPYQKEGIRFAFGRGRTIIADEMGLGKTIQAIGTAELLRREGLAGQVMVVCPTSLKYQWQREIERFTGGRAKVLVIEGNPLKRREQYGSDVHYKIVSYNCMANDVKAWGSLTTDVLVMDEVQRLKNWKTQISIAARKIKSDYAVILSGTPLENKLEELYSVMELADQYCLGPFWKFKDDCILTDESGKVVGYKNLNRIGQQVRNRLIRRTKREVALQMPRRQDQNLLVPMTKEQMDVHNEFKVTVANLVMKWRRMHFLSEKDRQRLLLSLSQMRMVCDSTYILDQKTRFDTKVTETMGILQSVFEGGDEKVVVFSQWERMTRLIARELDQLGVGYEYLHGGIPSKDRKNLISNFTDDPDCRVFLSTDAGSTGLNLQAASIIINLDLPWNPAVLEQRIARIYRLGQERNVQVINLVAKDTIEEQMIEKLRFKSAMFEGVLDNGEDTIFVGNETKFTAMMDTLGDIVEEEKPTKGEDAGRTAAVAGNEQAGDESDKPEPIRETQEPASVEEAVLEDGDGQFVQGELPFEPMPSEESPVKNSSHTGEPKPSGQSSPADTEAQEIIRHGMSFFAGLARTLQSPEATERLVESLVETDAGTGESHLRIPVPDKQTVSTLLGALGKLFNK